MKTYVITLSSAFPVGHARAGEPTFFKQRFLNALNGHGTQEIYAEGEPEPIITVGGEKLHTIRANFPLWEKRIAEVQSGTACLSVRQWSGAPYKSPQVEIGRLTAEDGVGVQRLDLSGEAYPVVIDGVAHLEPKIMQNLAAHDGLSLEDWEDWFKGYDKSQPLAIIHFTNFRY